MKYKQYIFHTLLISVMATLFTGCFTGIESTPKITAKDVKRQKAEVTPEMNYARDVTGEPAAEWNPGKEFIVTDSKISLATSPIFVAERLHAGDTVKFIGNRAAKSMTDIDDTIIMFLTPQGDTLNYRVQEPMEKMLERSSIEIPFTIELSIVESAAKLMNGQSYYITTPVWFNENGDNIAGQKFIEVQIDSITAGNSSYPLAVYFTAGNGTHSKVFMSTGHGRRSTRNFETLFSLSNPRDKYKDITDDVWECITHSTIKLDMTREQCRLSLGSPREVIRGHYLELWRYDSGVTLIFDDGYLRRIR